MRKVLTIKGMSCGHCVGRVEKLLASFKGVGEYEVDLTSESATITVVEGFDEVKLKESIEDAGYEVKEIK